MCGFAGFKQVSSLDAASPRDVLRDMANSILHRGPDDEGVWFHESSGVGMSHRRLAIQDVSVHGAQPMISNSGRYVLAFNGEIYNFNDLKNDFIKEGCVFRGHSDTEVMLACFEKWGIKKALSLFEGMFAFALFDAKKNILHLARDRMGEKPLYYGWNKYNTFLFGSELKALRRHPHFDDSIDRNAIALLMRYNYIPAPYSIYSTIKKLEPGCYLTINVNTETAAEHINKYWDVSEYFKCEGESLSQYEYRDELERLLKLSVRQQMVSDVPLGAFLSGGIDSSTIVALMQMQSIKPIKTFCIGFNEKSYDEAVYAKKIAKHLGTDHTELYINADDSLEVIPSLPTIYDEPFADSSQIPTYLISRLAKQKVTVSLSGDGGDELFCGYERYFEYIRAWNELRGKRTLSQLMQTSVLENIPLSLLAPFIKFISSSQRNYSLAYINEKIQRHNSIRRSLTLQEFYEKSIGFWFDADRVVKGAEHVSIPLRDYPVSQICDDGYKKIMYLDSISYLPDDILVKVDRAAMANSLETRVPFLNHRVVEFAASIPSNMQTNGISGKHMLRDILYKYVPKPLFERPKQGFAVPMKYWLRTHLRDWGESLLEEGRLKQEGYFNEQLITRKWREHLSGNADHSFQLWGVLAFQAWLEQAKAENR